MSMPEATPAGLMIPSSTTPRGPPTLPPPSRDARRPRAAPAGGGRARHEARAREHLEGPREVQDLDALEDQDARIPLVHVKILLPGDTGLGCQGLDAGSLLPPLEHDADHAILELTLQDVGGARQEIQHAVVVREHIGPESADAPRLACPGDVVEEYRPEAPPLPAVLDDEGHLGGGGPVGRPAA